MFTKTAKYYDLIYGFKDYAREARDIAALVRREHPEARSILDVACGTGEHARFLSQTFSIDGIDVEPAFIDMARNKVPGGTFSVANMQRFDLRRRYDVVVCLFSSIGYLLQESAIVSALRCFADHLADGGVIIVEPWFTPEAWQVGRPSMTPPVDQPDLKICRVNTAGRRGNVALVDFHHVIATPEGVEHVQEDHELALYSVDQMLECFAHASLRVSHDPTGLTGRGLYIARRLQSAPMGTP